MVTGWMSVNTRSIMTIKCMEKQQKPQSWSRNMSSPRLCVVRGELSSHPEQLSETALASWINCILYIGKCFKRSIVKYWSSPRSSSYGGCQHGSGNSQERSGWIWEAVRVCQACTDGTKWNIQLNMSQSQTQWHSILNDYFLLSYFGPGQSMENDP